MKKISEDDLKKLFRETDPPGNIPIHKTKRVKAEIKRRKHKVKKSEEPRSQNRMTLKITAVAVLVIVFFSTLFYLINFRGMRENISWFYHEKLLHQEMPEKITGDISNNYLKIPKLNYSSAVSWSAGFAPGSGENVPVNLSKNNDRLVLADKLKAGDRIEAVANGSVYIYQIVDFKPTGSVSNPPENPQKETLTLITPKNIIIAEIAY